MPNQVDDVLLHTMSGTELSRVRVEPQRRRILAARHVLRSAGRRDSRIRYGTRADPGWRAHVRRGRPRPLGRLQRSVSRFPKPWSPRLPSASPLASASACSPSPLLRWVPVLRWVPASIANQPAYLDPLGALPAALRVPRRRIGSLRRPTSENRLTITILSLVV
jgi:hypothetical protein